MKIIKLTESDIQKIIKSSVQKVLKEEYDIDDFGGLSDGEYNELQQQIIDAYEKEDEDMKDYYDSSFADAHDNDDYGYSPSDGDLYMFGM